MVLFRPLNFCDIRITLFDCCLKVCLCLIKIYISLQIIAERILNQFHASLIV